MKNFENIQLLTLANTLVSLLSAFVLGSIVGFERQFRQRTRACAPTRWWRWARLSSSTWPFASAAPTAARA